MIWLLGVLLWCIAAVVTVGAWHAFLTRNRHDQDP